MVKHIRSLHIGESPYGLYNLTVSIDDVEYQVLSVSESDYKAYKKRLQYGQGYNAFNYLRDKYEVMKIEKNNKDKELFQQELNKFFTSIRDK